jgi:hypothetical protein
MAVRRILRLALLILLLVWEPGEAPVHVPRAEPEGGGVRIDMGLRVDPARPWTGWRLYLDLRRAGPAAEPAEEPSPEAEPGLELGPGNLVRAAGGAPYLLLRGGLELLRGGEGGGSAP